ncbi:long-chain fatty acid--CoA ligase [Kineosporia sp. R_H_3]|uniref:acyl-CoA synthetase n=1 Tax=Kineosporia sp. R_H_3 TaxID=1961848 RepID=UPI0018E9D991|nr:long-chain fatty acid--CoA ligase [Kineosporia sp. R_H_3]
MTALPPQNLGLGTWPHRRARITPDAVALVQGHRSLTYAGLDERVRRVAAALSAAGVRPGDRVAYLGPNDISTFETFFGAGLLGAVHVALNTRLSAAEIAYMLDDCAPTVLVHAASLAHLVPAVLPASVRRVLVVEDVKDVEAGQHVLPAAGETARPFEAALGEVEPLAEVPAVGLDDPCLVLYTSGTTGRPKGAVLTHGNLTWNTVNQLAHVDVLSTERALCIAPLFHVVGLGQVTLPTLFKGGSVEVLARFDAEVVLSAVSERGITSFACVPTMLQMMCEHPAWDGSDLSTLRTVIYGGSPVQERVAVAWHRRGVQVVQGFGMTEAAPGVCMQIRDGAGGKPVSIGPPHFFVDVAGHTAGGPVDLGDAPAELLVRGPNVFAGYLGRAEESAEAFPEPGWFRTGDIVRRDGDGWFYAVDRAKDMIISGGENIYPAEVEAVAVQLDEVAAAAVVATPDERWGEVGHAYVELRPGADLDEDRFRAHLLAHLARYKVPKYVTFVESLPRNATGKILRVRLREAARAD